jgi:hypothetical protein
MKKVDQINAIIENGGRLVFRKDGCLWLVSEATDYELCANVLGKEDDPWSSQRFDWGDLRFTSDDLLAAHADPSPGNLKKLGIREQDVPPLKEGG